MILKNITIRSTMLYQTRQFYFLHQFDGTKFLTVSIPKYISF